MAQVRPYREGDVSQLWRLKQAFERELGTATGGDGKATAYEAKLDEDYREGYLSFVDRCTDGNPGTVQVAEADGLVGYVFILPESLSHIWDAAVLNELYVSEAYRGTGVVDELVAAALDVAREQSLPMDRIVLDVDPDNERARAVYDRWGFEPWGELVVREL